MMGILLYPSGKIKCSLCGSVLTIEYDKKEKRNYIQCKGCKQKIWWNKKWKSLLLYPYATDIVVQRGLRKLLGGICYAAESLQSDCSRN